MEDGTKETFFFFRLRTFSLLIVYPDFLPHCSLVSGGLGVKKVNVIQPQNKLNLTINFFLLCVLCV